MLGLHNRFSMAQFPASFLVGLIGAGIQASRTPPMHEREGAELGLRYIYKLIDLEQLKLGAEALPELLSAAERMGFSGLNITFPCKQSVIPLLTDLSDDARARRGEYRGVTRWQTHRPQHRWVGFCRRISSRTP